MKYFIDENNCKVALFNVTPTIKKDAVYGYDLSGECHRLPACEVFDDGEQDYVYVSIPVKFPKGFVPPETFDKKRCTLCPFHFSDDGEDNCCLTDIYCPIKRAFPKNENTYKTVNEQINEFRVKVEQMPEPYRSQGMVVVEEMELREKKRREEIERSWRKKNKCSKQ